MSENFQRQLEKLPEYLGAHLTLSMLALGIGITITVPAAVLLAKRERVRWPVVTTAGVLQTVPGLAMLALLVPLVGFGFLPALIALTVYSVYPILDGTITGIREVDPAVTEAARGIGMTPGQVLRAVELPLAAPVILAGIRTATVWVVGIATLSTPVGQTSLGNYLFSGLQTRNWTAVWIGCACAALLVIVLERLLALAESGLRRRSVVRIVASTALLVFVLGAGIASPDRVRAVSSGAAASGAGGSVAGEVDRGLVRIGAKTFTEQYILASLIEQRLLEAGFRTDRRDSLGSTVAFDALRSGDLDVYVDYTGTIWANAMQRSDTPTRGEGLATVSGWLAAEHGIACLGPLGFENAYALATTRELATRHGVASIADLAAVAGDFEIGGDYEFFDRPEWYKLRETYGLRFAKTVSYDSTFMYEAVASGDVDVISAFSSDGRIAAFDLVVLDDVRGAFPPYDAVLLLSPGAARRPRLREALRPLLDAISVEDMRSANWFVDRDDGDKLPPDEAARWLGERIGS